MADNEAMVTEKEESEGTLIDSIYHKFVRGVNHAIGSTEFYEFFRDSLDCAEKEFQFSNRRVIKAVDLKWVEEIEGALNALQNIIYSPRNVIKEEELVVNVANARKAGSETVRHLAVHSSLVEDFNQESGDVRPSKLMQRFREDTIGMYENRLVYTTLEYTHHFVKVRHDALLEAMGDEYGAKLRVNTDMDCATELVHLDMFLHIREKESILETDEKHGDVLERISRINRVISTFMGSDFAQELAKQPRVSGTVNKTNILKKNPDYKVILRLWEFLRTYNDVGYSIRIDEQNPEINEEFQENIYRNILFNYLILKGYLEKERDRKLPVDSGAEKKELKPKVIHEIIEELTQDYDLPDVEVRKILIEELTREQLMHEEAAERLRLVEEQEGRRTEEEAQRLEEERLAEEERRKAQEEEDLRSEEELRERDAEDRRRSDIFREEIEYFRAHLGEQLAARRDLEEQWNAPYEDFEDLARSMEEEELRKRAMEQVRIYAEELSLFHKNLNNRLKQRKQAEDEYHSQIEERERLRRERLAKKMLAN